MRRKDSSVESVRIDRPKRTVPTPVDAFLEDRGDKKVGPSLAYCHPVLYDLPRSWAACNRLSDS